MKIELNDRAKKDFAKLDKHIQIQIFKKLKFIESLNDPKDDGKPLAGNLLGLWRYRSGDYRILAQILDDKLIILVVKISHRKNVYDFKKQ
ncbi:type II toxin-antitoxin system RelE family toxin [Campylobacter ureolyticus]|uniref:type II toxin-antitoxin system RelE family toxin n=1 Tax=Campylobacter ureolyticus TaxID=827 RepID=UPI0022B5918D|nr:type II toxin-antitoxin system RelE/ParE family toxin [Campylobacter ureolyticus]MCZ6155593.1 type II toxin-antitoxin system RelE/ParE family toxin [Campylobacter ureolyticus]MCZ6168264.1 type II toxin-antitoxin system RelE/ParE family toxin [Campylobacter ureolyticus]